MSEKHERRVSTKRVVVKEGYIKCGLGIREPGPGDGGERIPAITIKWAKSNYS